MKQKNTLTIVIGILLVIVFALMVFSFQVRLTEVAVVTTFDKPTDPILKPGLYWKWPRPIQKVYKFDKRVHNFEDKFEQTFTRASTLTHDNYPLLAWLYVGWTIVDPQAFFNSFPGGQTKEAEPALEGLIRTAKNEVIGQHPFSHFVSTDPNELKFVEVEKEILEAIRPTAKVYGVEIRFVGIKKLGLPESVTEKVFTRMQAERSRVVDGLKGEGENRATLIKTDADLYRDNQLALAQGKAMQIRGEAEAEAATALKVLDSQPGLAIFLLKIRALNDVFKEHTTLILDNRTSPLDLLTEPSKPSPEPAGAGAAGGNARTP